MIKHNLPPGDYVGISKAGTTVAVVITEGGFWAHKFRSKLQVELDDIASIMPARPEARNDTAGDEANIALTEHMEESGQDLVNATQKPDDLYLNVKPSNPADWCFDKKNLLVLVDDNFKGIVGENVTREQVGEIAKLLEDK